MKRISNLPWKNGEALAKLSLRKCTQNILKRKWLKLRTKIQSITPEYEYENEFDFPRAGHYLTISPRNNSLNEVKLTEKFVIFTNLNTKKGIIQDLWHKLLQKMVKYTI